MRAEMYLCPLMFRSLRVAQATTITMWDFLEGGDGARMAELVDMYNSSQTQVQVERTSLEWGVPCYTKVRTSYLGASDCHFHRGLEQLLLAFHHRHLN